MENNYIVYIHISPSDKRYVGITSQKPNERWKNGNGYKNNIHFTRAIEKYGWDNFEHIIIARGLDEETAKWLEIELIREWDSTNKEKGYNISPGGDIVSEETRQKLSSVKSGENHPMFGKQHSEKTKEKMSKTKSGENNPMFGKQHSEETKEKISESLIGKMTGENHPMYGVHRYGEEAPNYGKHHSEETKEKIRREIEKRGGIGGEKNPNAKKIICLETMKIFNCIKDASEKMNCCYTGLVNAIKKHKKYKGYTFIYYKDFLNGEIDIEL